MASKRGRQGIRYLLGLALFVSWGCYNNAHLRTQRMLDPGEKVVTASGNLPVASKDVQGTMQHGGVPGLRGEVAILTGRPQGEAGAYAGVGLHGGGSPDFILGGEWRRYKTPLPGMCVKLGLQGELNIIPGNHYPSGKILHVRPSIISVTDSRRTTYYGVHGLLAAGTQHSAYYWEDAARSSISSVGIGVTMGRERFSLAGISSQFQIDASWVQSTYSGVGGNAYYRRGHSGFIVTASVGLNFFSRPVGRDLGRGASHRLPRPSALPAQPSMVAKRHQEFDPETGDTLVGQPRERYDPITGKRLPVEIQEEPPPRFDPTTGAPESASPAAVTPSVIAEKSPAPTLTSTEIHKLAVAAARSHYEGRTWQFSGGLLGCGGMVLGGIVGAGILDSFGGFVIGAGAGGVGTVELLLSTPPPVHFPKELAQATAPQREIFMRSYVAETQALRRKGAYGGIAGIAAAAAFGLLFLIGMS